MILYWTPTPTWLPGREEKAIKNKKINIGIGFVTGRKNFRNVVRTYLHNWNLSEETDMKKYALHLFVAYDLKFTNTELSDYQITDEEILAMVDSVHYLGRSAIANEARGLVEKKVLSTKEARLVFGDGYAMKRNAVLYFSMVCKMDALIFFDDDEYPVASVKRDGRLVWEGQPVLAGHIDNILKTDMTNGYHCGYISPIPNLQFNEALREEDFRVLIEVISNDIVNWESVKRKMEDGGITYADMDQVSHEAVHEVEAVDGMKFISGANLGINLRNPDKLYPFYNPPGARGEDTFLSTCICGNQVMRIPYYTFHDGFLAYGGLLSGALPNALVTMKPNSAVITKRFLKAVIGWIRYKPLLVYITQNGRYEAAVREMQAQLEYVIPKLCDYYQDDGFAAVLEEFQFYQAHVERHYQDFMTTKTAWRKMMDDLKTDGRPMEKEREAQ